MSRSFDSLNFVSVPVSYILNDEFQVDLETWDFEEALLVQKITDNGEVILRRSGSDHGQNIWNTRDEVSDVELGIFPPRARVADDEVIEDLNSVYEESVDETFLNEPNWLHLVQESRAREELAQSFLWRMESMETVQELARLASEVKLASRDFLLRKSGKLYDDKKDKDGVIISYRKTGIGLNYERYAFVMNSITQKACLLKVGRAPVATDEAHAKKIDAWVSKNVASNFRYFWIKKFETPVVEKKDTSVDALDNCVYSEWLLSNIIDE